ITGDGRHVLVTNAGSGDASLFAIADGTPSLVQTAKTGPAPKSIAEHDGLVYVLNTGGPSIAGFRLADGSLEPLAQTSLPAGSAPAQIGSTPDGSALAVTQRGTDAIAVYPVDDAGRLGEPQVQPSSGPTPYGFAFTHGGTMVVTEAFGAQVGRAAASS